MNRLFAVFTSEPLAAASIAQVHHAVLHNGEVVAVKVRRPDIEERIEADLAILADLAGLVAPLTVTLLALFLISLS